MTAQALEFPPGTSAGPLDPARVLAVEQLVGRPFDEAFLELLVEQNGGPPRARLLVVEGRVKVLERFLCLVDPRENPRDAIYDVGTVWSMLKGRLQASLVPFAVLFPGDFLCFDHSAPGPPSVVWWKHEAPAGAPAAPTVPVAGSFTALLAMLRPDD
jgi:hypothetical protein